MTYAVGALQPSTTGGLDPHSYGYGNYVASTFAGYLGKPAGYGLGHEILGGFVVEVDGRTPFEARLGYDVLAASVPALNSNAVAFKWTGARPVPHGTSRSKDGLGFATPKMAAVDGQSLRGPC